MNTLNTPATTTRVVLPGLVEPAGLQLHTEPTPTPAAGQLLVAVEATGISYAEQAMRRGRYFGQPDFPFTPGYDLVGRVVSAGSPVDAGLVGRRVATLTKTGAWATHAVVAARDSIVVPETVSSADAETVVVNGVTAWQMLHRAARVQPGQTILLFGANGGVGGILIQLARHAGIHVIGAASPRHHDPCAPPVSPRSTTAIPTSRTGCARSRPAGSMPSSTTSAARSPERAGSSWPLAGPWCRTRSSPRSAGSGAC